MAKYKNRLVYNRVKDILSSYRLVIIGQYDNNQAKLWKELKKANSLYIPKNSLCKKAINDVIDYRLASNTGKLEESLFEGPIFMLCTDKLENPSIFQALLKLKNTGIVLYGGFLDQKLLNFSDVRELTSLLKEEKMHQKPYSQLESNVTFFASFFSKMNCKLFQQLESYKKNRS